MVEWESSWLHTFQGRRTPSRQQRADQLEGKTVFGRRYLGISVDEAHGFCDVNKLYGAVRALREKTDFFVAMSATPLKLIPEASPLCTSG